MWRKISVLLSCFSPNIRSFISCSASPEPSGISRLKQQCWWGGTGLPVALCIFLHPRQDKHSGNPHITENLENWNKIMNWESSKPMKISEIPTSSELQQGSVGPYSHSHVKDEFLWLYEEGWDLHKETNLLNCCSEILPSTYSKYNQLLAGHSEQLVSNTWICSYIQPHLNCQTTLKNIGRYSV